MATKYWYPRTCSEDQGCILENTSPTVMSGLSKTCHGHKGDFGRSIGIPAFTGLAHNAPITGDQAVYDAILANNIAGTEEPLPAFKLYDELRYADLTSFGMGPILVIYESSMHPSGSSATLPPNISFLQTAFQNIKNANPGVTRVCLDYEAWGGNGAIPTQSIQYYVDLVTVAHDYWPDVGVYSTVPERYTLYLNFATTHATYIQRKADWTARCASLGPIWDVVNTIYPSYYYINPVYNNWTKMLDWLNANDAIIESNAPGKNNLAFLWPRVHNSVDATTPYIDGTHFRNTLDFLLTHADGAVLWDAVAEPSVLGITPEPAWWTQAKDFVTDNGITV